MQKKSLKFCYFCTHFFIYCHCYSSFVKLDFLFSRAELQQTVTWIQTHLEVDPDVSLPKQDVYDEYMWVLYIFLNTPVVKNHPIIQLLLMYVLQLNAKYSQSYQGLSASLSHLIRQK